MSKFLGDGFSNILLAHVIKAKSSLIIISPYLSLIAARELLPKVPDKLERRILVTLPVGPEYFHGTVDIDALVELHRNGFEIRTLNNLHAKLYIVDKEVYVGSANFTSNGWKLKEKQGNVEDMIRIQLSPKDLAHIESRYLDATNALLLSSEFVSEIKTIILTHKSLLDQYKKIDKTFMKAANKIQRILVREYFSRYYPYTKEYLYNFMFALAKSTGEGAIADKVDFQLNLGGTKDKYHESILVPYSIMRKVLTKSHLDGANKSFQFQISIDDEGVAYLRSANKVKKKEERFKLERTTLEGTLEKRQRE